MCVCVRERERDCERERVRERECMREIDKTTDRDREGTNGEKGGRGGGVEGREVKTSRPREITDL